MTGTCSACRWWDRDAGFTEGQCRVMGPSFAGEVDNRTTQPSQGVWPTTFADDWCGEFAPREEG